MTDEGRDPAGSWASPSGFSGVGSSPAELRSETVHPRLPAAAAYGAPPPGAAPPSARPGSRRTAGIAIGISALAVGLVALVVAAGVAVLGPRPVVDAQARVPADPIGAPWAAADGEAPPPRSEGARGEAVTTAQGVSITVTGMTAEPGAMPTASGASSPEGRFVSVALRLVNRVPEQIKVSATDFSVLVNGTEYTPVSEASVFGDTWRTARVDSGQGGVVTLVFDLPDGAMPTLLIYQRLNSFDSAVAVSLDTTPVASSTIGQTLRTSESVTNTGSLAVTIDALDCGATTAPSDDGPVEPDGVFCRIDGRVINETTDDYRLSAVDLTLLLDDGIATSSSPANRFDGVRRSAVVPPGQTGEFTIWYDIDPGSEPIGVRFATYWGSAVTFDIR